MVFMTVISFWMGIHYLRFYIFMVMVIVTFKEYYFLRKYLLTLRLFIEYIYIALPGWDVSDFEVLYQCRREFHDTHICNSLVARSFGLLQ